MLPEVTGLSPKYPPTNFEVYVCHLRCPMHLSVVVFSHFTCFTVAHCSGLYSLTCPTKAHLGESALLYVFHAIP